jgi:hypothetical protein
VQLPLVYLRIDLDNLRMFLVRVQGYNWALFHSFA